jgi:hypothetical protein
LEGVDAALVARPRRVYRLSNVPRGRTVIRLAATGFGKGMPQDEIARYLGSNRNALYKLTHDARKRLRQGLEAAGFTAEDVGTAFSG